MFKERRRSQNLWGSGSTNSWLRSHSVSAVADGKNMQGAQRINRINEVFTNNSVFITMFAENILFKSVHLLRLWACAYYLIINMYFYRIADIIIIMIFIDVSLGWLVVFNVPSTARSFRDGTPIYCPLRRTWSSINTPFRPGIEPRAVAWQSITLPLRYASFIGSIFILLCIKIISVTYFSSCLLYCLKAYYNGIDHWVSLSTKRCIDFVYISPSFKNFMIGNWIMVAMICNLAGTIPYRWTAGLFFIARF